MNTNLDRLLAYTYCWLAALILTGAVAAQTGPFTQAWVDPIVGNDGTGTTSVPPNATPGRPYRTLAAAIAAVKVNLPPSQEGIVWAQPGIYSSQTNGEMLPVFMENGISVLATGDAKETVLRATGSPNLWSVFVPDSPRCGSGKDSQTPALPASLLVYFSGFAGTNNPDGVRPTVLSGFTLQGGDVQVYLHTEVKFFDPRVSNCIFDLRNFDSMDSHPAVGSPRFGLQLVTVWDLPIAGYPQVPFKVFNNTFLFNTLSTTDADADVDAVGIVNVTAPCPKPNPDDNDPNDVLRGVSAMSVQNNLFRITGDNVPMLGVSGADVNLGAGYPSGPTNAFPRNNVSNSSANGTYYSVGSGVTTPRVDLSAVPAGGGPRLDPAFAGEYFPQLSGQFAGSTLDDLDWRLLPSPQNSVIDAGGMFDALGRFDSLSGVSYTGFVPPVTLPTRRTQHFAMDGEGWANPRIVGELPDIGYDEADVFLQGGSYGESSRSHNVPIDLSGGFATTFPGAAPSGIPAGSDARVSVFPGGPVGASAQFFLAWTFYAGVAWTVPPGIASAPATYPGYLGDDWLSGGMNYTVLPTTLLAPSSYVHALTGVAHSVQIATQADANDAIFGWPALHSNVQVVYRVPGRLPVISNLSREFF